MATKKDSQAQTHDLSALHKNTQILREPQFTHSDVCDITSLKYDQLRRWISRELSELQIGARGRQTGGRRLYSGGDIIQLATVKSLNDAGIPIKFGARISENVLAHSHNLLNKISEKHGMTLFIYPIFEAGETIDWEYKRAYLQSGEEIDIDIPPVTVMFAIDELIEEVLTKLQRIIQEDTYED